jgi:DNA adenine methylase
MRYFGGKQRISKPLAAFLNSQLKPGQAFYDMFCGSCNVISKIDPNRDRVASDLHKELIAMWRHVQQGGELPDEISEEQYKQIKESGAGWLRAFVGFGCSFAGKYWGGYARDNRGGTREYCRNAKNSTLKKMATMRDVLFVTCDYRQMNIVHKNAMIYCDIPYKDSVGYSVGKFNHEAFYAWAKKQKWKGHTMLVSEYKHNVPEGWKVVWEYESKKDIRDKDGVQQPTVEILMTPC